MTAARRGLLTAAALALGLAHAGPARGQPDLPPSVLAVDSDDAPAAGSAAGAAASNDYDPASDAWNGLSSLVRLAEGVAQLEVVPVATLEWGELDAEDILVLIYPLRRVDPGRLSAFIQAGGNVIIADDFGEAGDAMSRLDLLRVDPGTVATTSFHASRPYAPIAHAVGDHALARDVTDVVTNHPAVMSNLRGADAVVAFGPDQIVVAAGERGTGRFVAVSDPSIFINRMQQFPGNLQLTANMLRWLDRSGRAKRLVLLRGDVPMFGEPRAFIDDANASRVGRGVADLNRWLGDRSDWLLTSGSMRVIAGVLALLLVGLVLTAMPVRRSSARPDGSWLRLGRRARRDAPEALVASADAGGPRANFITAACVLRDVAQAALSRAVDAPDPLHSRPESELHRALRANRGEAAAVALARVYPRLRALPSRSLAAAAWGGGRMTRREFDQLYADVEALCRTLGEPIAALPAGPA